MFGIEEFTSTISEFGFTQLKTYYCCFIWREENNFTILIVWVDHILSFSLTEARNNWIKKELKGKFEVK
jgi:hypothetical protein